jgi:hypothetical protein
MPMDEPLRFGYTLDRFHDQGRLMHLFQPNNAPACGCKYYASSGTVVRVATSEELKRHVVDVYSVCRRCLTIATKRLSARALIAGTRGKLVFVKAGTTKPGDEVISGHHRDKAAHLLSRKEEDHG